MTKSGRIVDFQIYVRAAGTVADGQRLQNEALFATYEPVRLWLQEREILAPFRKLLISLNDQAFFAKWHGNVSVAAGVCEVTEAVDLASLPERTHDHRWVLGIVRHALEQVATKTGWYSAEFDAFLSAMSNKDWPLTHVFEKLKQTDATGMKCAIGLDFAPGSTHLFASLSRDGEAGQVAGILSKRGPIFLEDDFPLAKTAIRPPFFVLLDKAGRVLVNVPLEPAPP